MKKRTGTSDLRSHAARVPENVKFVFFMRLSLKITVKKKSFDFGLYTVAPAL